MYQTAEELLSQAQERSVSLWQIVPENEMELTEKTERQVFDRLEKTHGVMKRSATEAPPSPQHAIGGLVTGVSQIRNEYLNLDSSLCGSQINHSAALAFLCSEVNVAMERVCTTPTADACGILPVVLLSAQGKRGLMPREVLCGLLTAVELGVIITRNATVAGAEGGCQAGCGAAAAMVLTAAVGLCHGSSEAALHAGSFCLINAMGLVCDPAAELVQVPYAQRNASQTTNVLLSADWALVSQCSVILPDQVIVAMYHTGKMLPTQLRKTTQSGLAATPAAKSIFENIFIKHEETKAL